VVAYLPERNVGAGDEKFAITVGYRKASEGKKVKENYYKRLPKVKKLIDNLKKQWKSHPYKRGGYIQVAGDTWVWCPSEHKLLNYLLMGSEAALQNEAICWVNMQIEKEGLSGKQLGSFHDELTHEFDLTEKEKGIKLMTQMYGEASRRFKLEVPVTGTAQSGRNWAEIH